MSTTTSPLAAISAFLSLPPLSAVREHDGAPGKTPAALWIMDYLANVHKSLNK